MIPPSSQSVVNTEAVVRALWWPAGQERLGSVFAILDAARHEAIYPTMREASVPYCCLYRGAMSPALAAVAPYLVRLRPQDAFTRWMISEGWGDEWGIFLVSTSSMNDLRRHFRRFLMVRDEAGQSLYFRYYDPAIWQVYLPTCTEHERAYVFGPVEEYITEGEDATHALAFSHVRQQLHQRVVPLEEAAKDAHYS